MLPTASTGTLRCLARRGGLGWGFYGTATFYQWCRCNSATPDVPVAIDGAAIASYTPTENGIYYVAVTGGNVGYNPYGAEHPEGYTTNGVLAMVASLTNTMYSDAVEVTGL